MTEDPRITRAKERVAELSDLLSKSDDLLKTIVFSTIRNTLNDLLQHINDLEKPKTPVIGRYVVTVADWAYSAGGPAHDTLAYEHRHSVDTGRCLVASTTLDLDLDTMLALAKQHDRVCSHR